MMPSYNVVVAVAVRHRRWMMRRRMRTVVVIRVVAMEMVVVPLAIHRHGACH